MKFVLLMNVKMPTIVDILTFMSRQNSIRLIGAYKMLNFLILYTYEHLKFHAQLR